MGAEEDRPDWQKGQIQLKYGGSMPKDAVDWNKIVMAFEPGAADLEKDYPDWVKGTVYEEGSGACDYDISKKLVLNIGAKTGNYTEENVVNLTAEEGDLTGFILEMSLYTAGHGSANLSYIQIDGNLFFVFGAEIHTGGLASHSRIIILNEQDDFDMRGAPWFDGIQALHIAWVDLSNVSAGNHTFKVVFDFNGWANQNFLKLWILYGSTVNLTYIKANV